MKSIQESIKEKDQIITETEQYFKLNKVWLDDRTNINLQKMVIQGDKVKQLIKNHKPATDGFKRT